MPFCIDKSLKIHVFEAGNPYAAVSEQTESPKRPLVPGRVGKWTDAAHVCVLVESLKKSKKKKHLMSIASG